MKKLIAILVLFPFLLSCNEGEKRTGNAGEIQVENSQPADTSSGDAQEEVLEETVEEQDGVAHDTATEVQKESVRASLEGKYKKIDSEGKTGPCNCSCIEVSFSKPTQLCISAENIYITARFEKSGNSTADIYFEHEVQSDALGKDIPWEDFDRNIPIATVSLQPDNSLKLDWEGFTINGELAVDYAIYGKKTLEGNYIPE